jgi:hypothetical protein
VLFLYGHRAFSIVKEALASQFAGWEGGMPPRSASGATRFLQLSATAPTDQAVERIPQLHANHDSLSIRAVGACAGSSPLPNLQISAGRFVFLTLSLADHRETEITIRS